MPPTDPLPEDDAKLSPEAIREIVRRRHTALLEKWFSGKASEREAKEIEYILRQLPNAHHAPELPMHSAAGNGSDPPQNASEHLRRTGYRELLTTYAKQYKTDERTIKRWIQKGKNTKPPNPPPLDDPAEMPGWWCRVSKQKPPEGIMGSAAELERKSVGTTVGANVAAVSTESERSESINLANIATPEGLALQHARVFVAATYLKLEAAFAAGNDDEIRLWQPRWEKATETLRRAESADREAQKHRGELVSVADVQSDLAQFLHVLKTIRASAAKRIIARMPQLGQELAADLRTAIEIERSREDDALRNLQTLRAPEELEERFQLKAN